MTSEGLDVSLADIIAAGGGQVGADGLIKDAAGENVPFLWEFGPNLPKPEDYVLARSGVRLEDIYRASEWEGQLPLSPVPVVQGVGPVAPANAAERAKMPANHPVNFVPKGEKLH